MKLYFTRHGKTEWNEAGRFQGMHGDSPLLPTSYKEIQLLGNHLKEIPFQAIYASTQKRARVTAEEIRKKLSRPVDIFLDQDLREMGYGDLEGKSIVESYKLYEQALTNRQHHLHLYDPSEFKGEATDIMLRRMMKSIQQAVSKHDGPLLFVGHGSSMTAAIQYLLGKKLADLRSMGGLANNSLTILETRDKSLPYDLVKWNCLDFLTE